MLIIIVYPNGIFPGLGDVDGLQPLVVSGGADDPHHEEKISKGNHITVIDRVGDIFRQTFCANMGAVGAAFVNQEELLVGWLYRCVDPGNTLIFRSVFGEIEINILLCAPASNCDLVIDF